MYNYVLIINVETLGCNINYYDYVLMITMETLILFIYMYNYVLISGNTGM